MLLDLAKALKDWATENLENIGVYKDKSPKFEEFQQKLIEGLKKTYSEEALSLFFNRTNMRPLPSPNGFAKLTGPCGDTMQIYLKVENGGVTEASFDTDGCMPSIISGAMVVQLARGKSLNEAQQIDQDTVLKALGGLPDESTHCALLAANTLKEAIKDALSRSQ
ncbi:MAG: iron-sulfur cluster assembly scaffold protein [Deltaproteobacteria bacterium]|nr:iron-sulfur cluster assembly scaffold protein [Deltaproteobacteria bacterium]